MLNGDRKLNIVFFVPWITKGRGGTENVGQMMANAMAARGHRVGIFTFDDDRAPSRWPLRPEINLHYLTEKNSQENDMQIMMVAQLASRRRGLFTALSGTWRPPHSPDETR